MVVAVRCAYNHVLLEKTLRLYQICCLTRRKTAAILRIYLEHALFHRLTGDHVYKSDLTRPDLAFGFINKSSGNEIRFVLSFTFLVSPCIRLVFSCLEFCLFLSCLVCLVSSCLVSSYPVLSCLMSSRSVLLCSVLSCLVLSFTVLSCPILSWPVLSCLGKRF